MTRAGRLLAGAGALALLVLAGCSGGLQRVPLGAEPESEAHQLASPEGLAIAAYSTPDGVFHRFEGNARWTSLAKDSLELRGRRTGTFKNADPSGDVVDEHPVTLHLARDQVSTLIYVGSGTRSDRGRSSLLALGILTAVTLGLVVVYAIALNESD